MRQLFILPVALSLFLPAFVTHSFAQPQPDVCTGKRSCFMAFDGPDRGFCEAYVEGKSCFMALNGPARTDCDAGRIPRAHRHWLNLCRGW